MNNLPIDWWYICGIYFGYPECCIQAFCKLSHMQDSAFDEEGHNIQMNHARHGFVPCKICAEKLDKGEVKLKDLIKHRHAKKEFPNHSLGSRKAIENWFHKNCKNGVFIAPTCK